METPTFIPPESMPLKEWHAEDVPQSEEKPAEIQPNEAYTPTLFQGDDFNQFLDSLSSKEFDALEKYTKRNNAGRIWACTPQNCGTTDQTAFKKHASFQGISICRPVIYRLSA